MLESFLIDLCANNRDKRVKGFLEHHPNINVLHREGLAFFFAIKHRNQTLLKCLIDYYDEHVLSPQKPDTTQYNVIRHELKKAIEDALESTDTSDEILNYLKDRSLYKQDNCNSECSSTTDFSENSVKTSPLIFSPRKDPEPGCSYPTLSQESLAALNKLSATDENTDPNQHIINSLSSPKLS